MTGQAQHAPVLVQSSFGGEEASENLEPLDRCGAFELLDGMLFPNPEPFRWNKVGYKLPIVEPMGGKKKGLAPPSKGCPMNYPTLPTKIFHWAPLGWVLTGDPRTCGLAGDPSLRSRFTAPRLARPQAVAEPPACKAVWARRTRDWTKNTSRQPC